jgi:hypothetical protein
MGGAGGNGGDGGNGGGGAGGVSFCLFKYGSETPELTDPFYSEGYGGDGGGVPSGGNPGVDGASGQKNW